MLTKKQLISDFVKENYDILNFNDMFIQLNTKYNICRTTLYDVIHELNLDPNPRFLKTSYVFKIHVCKQVLQIINRSVTIDDYYKTIDIINNDYYQLNLSPAQINSKYHLDIKQPTASLYTAFGIKLSKLANQKNTKSIDKSEISNFNRYKAQCQFRFDPKHNPYIDGYNKFIQLGMWSCNNLNGVARDHKLSIKFGFENHIDPSIVSHPANCKFIPFRINSSKGAKCSITLEQLLEDIKNWPIQ